MRLSLDNWPTQLRVERVALLLFSRYRNSVTEYETVFLVTDVTFCFAEYPAAHTALVCSAHTVMRVPLGLLGLDLD